MSDTIYRAEALRRIVLTGEQMAGASSSDVVDAIHRAVSALPVVNASSKFLGTCKCGMTGPCMWDQCEHPLMDLARTPPMTG